MYNYVLSVAFEMLDYTSKRLLDKLLNKVYPAEPGIKSPVKEKLYSLGLSSDLVFHSSIKQCIVNGRNATAVDLYT